MGRKVALRLSAYKAVREAISSGIAFGIRRHQKYAQDPLQDATVASLEEHLEREIMSSLEEVVDWERSG